MTSSLATEHWRGLLATRGKPALPAFSLTPQTIAALTILASVGFSLAYTWFLCPLDLASDEAHYWEWSLRPDWSYYSKGPLVAWLIRASCELFGPASLAVRGDLGAAVRLPAILSHAALLAGSYLLAAGVFRSPRLGLWVVVAEATLPLVRAGSVLMTIDPPFLACWCWSLVCVWKAVGNDQEPNPRGGLWWLAAGGFTLLGTLAKYTMALFPIAIVCFLLFHRRSSIRRPGVWVFLAMAALAWLPIAVWNAQHDWASFRHVLGQVGGQSVGLRFNGLGPFGFVGAQLGMLFGGWLLAFVAAGWRFRPRPESAIGLKLLWWCSAPIWLLFAVASFVKPGQPNWPAPAYVGGMILGVAWVLRELRGRQRRAIRLGLAATVAGSIAAAAVVHFPDLIRPALARLAGPPSDRKPLPVRDLDITARLTGWKTLALEVDRIRAGIVSETGEEPILAGTNWTIPGHLRFYCQGHPETFALGLANGSDRHSQYDYWRPNPEKDAQAFAGRTFVIVGDVGSGVARGFDAVGPEIRVTHSENGVPISAWNIRVCRGFRGFAVQSEGRW